MKQQLIARWNSFSAREKHILALLALVMLCLSFYAFVWLPVQQGRARLARTMPEKQARLLLMRSQAAEIERLRGQYKSIQGTASGLKAAIEVSAKFHGLVPNYPAPEKNNDRQRLGKNQLEITLTQLNFDTWIKWLESLQNQNHIRVLSCRIIPAGAAQIRVEAVFTASEQG